MTAVLDASAILALLQGEPGADRVAAVIEGAWVSAVNLAEVATRLVERGMSDDEMCQLIDLVPAAVHPFDKGQALATGRLRKPTRGAGLSLGDRACLALASSLGAPVLTADRAWADLTVGIDVELIR